MVSSREAAMLRERERAALQAVNVTQASFPVHRNDINSYGHSPYFQARKDCGKLLKYITLPDYLIYRYITPAQVSQMADIMDNE